MRTVTDTQVLIVAAGRCRSFECVLSVCVCVGLGDTVDCMSNKDPASSTSVPGPDFVCVCVREREICFCNVNMCFPCQ